MLLPKKIRVDFSVTVETFAGVKAVEITPAQFATEAALMIDEMKTGWPEAKINTARIVNGETEEVLWEHEHGK